MLDIVIWMNQPSHYQGDFFRELSARPDCRLTVVYDAPLDSSRVALGWSVSAQVNAYREMTLPRRGGIGRVIRLVISHRRSTHVVNGIWAVPRFLLVNLLLAALGSEFYVLSEGVPYRVGARWKMWLKACIAKPILRSCRGVFAIGSHASRLYGALGVDERKLFEFAYFRNKDPVDSGDDQNIPRRGFSLLYVGQITKRKRVDDLIRAVAILKKSGVDVELTIVGAGDLSAECVQLTGRLGVADVVKLVGPVRHDRVFSLMHSASILVLPSEFDGWGLVANEALQSGVPVVVTIGCGVASLIEATGWGLVCDRESVASLVNAIRKVVESPMSFSPSRRDAEQTIGCKVMTDYFLRCIKWGPTCAGIKPVAPWRRGEFETAQ